MPPVSNAILNKYRILNEISNAGCRLYAAVDPALGRHVAIKELVLSGDLDKADRNERIRIFLQSGRAAGALSHRNITRVYDVGEDNGRYAMAMEFLEGTSLQAAIQNGGLEPRRVVEIALQICEALSVAHSNGVVHGGIAPDKIYILFGSTVKITDFGIAKISSPIIPALGRLFGNPAYMSPEQLAGRTVDFQTDIFSVGVVLYEMVTGRRLFPGDDPAGIVRAVLNAQPSMPSSISPGMLKILHGALAIDASQRCPSIALMAGDLRDELKSLEGRATSMPVGPGTLNTGSVPPEVSGIPASTAPGPWVLAAPQQYTAPPLQQPASTTQVPNGSGPRSAQDRWTPGAQAPPRSRPKGMIFGVAATAVVLIVGAFVGWFVLRGGGAPAATSVAGSKPAQAIFSDHFENGWQNYSWAKVDIASKHSVHQGEYSMFVDINQAYSGAFVNHPAFDPTGYNELTFWINGGPSGARTLFVCGVTDSKNAVAQRFTLAPIPANTWVMEKVPLSELDIYGKANFTGFFVQDSSGHTGSEFYLNDMQLD